MHDTFCSHCGTAFANTTSYPRQCAKCGVTVWANPIPVSVVVVPVQQGARLGVLVIRRAIEPCRGKLALVGGFLEAHETWQQGGAREVKEETGVVVDPAKLTPLWFTSTEPKPNRVLLFSVAEATTREALAPFTPDAETEERGLIFGPAGLEQVFAFSLHIEAVRRFFASKGLSGAHDYVTC